MKKRIAVLLSVLMMIVPAFSWAASSPACEVVLIRAKFKCGCSWDGMGTMIMRNGMITAAHNIVCHVHNKDLKECKFFFGWNGKTYRRKQSGRYTYAWYADFSKGYDHRNDIAYVIFNSESENFNTYSLLTDEDWNNYVSTVNVLGYKGDRIVEDWGTVRQERGEVISWPMSSNFKDCSQGGPVYSDGFEPLIMAVYTSNDGSRAYGRKITPQIIRDMESDGGKFR